MQLFEKTTQLIAVVGFIQGQQKVISLCTKNEFPQTAFVIFDAYKVDTIGVYDLTLSAQPRASFTFEEINNLDTLMERF